MKKQINLALQGGGAHGAFTWGVLDVLLQDPDLEIAAITGTSAGALNGAALKAGLAEGGPDAARENLNWLWGQISGTNDTGLTNWFSSVIPAPFIEYSPVFQALDFASRITSPYALGPFYRHPLLPVVDQLSYESICSNAGPELFICATNVRTGKVKVFETQEINSDVILASACLPSLFQAVEIDGEAYWDGGYTGNPALFPLYDERFPSDLLIVNINPLERHDVPKTPLDIQNRINEISFNSSLLRELRAIEFAQRLLDADQVKDEALKRLYVHMIADDELMRQLSVATKTIPHTGVIEQLKVAGQNAAKDFLFSHKTDLGNRGTVDLKAMFS